MDADTINLKYREAARACQRMDKLANAADPPGAVDRAGWEEAIKKIDALLPFMVPSSNAMHGALLYMRASALHWITIGIYWSGEAGSVWNPDDPVQQGIARLKEEARANLKLAIPMLRESGQGSLADGAEGLAARLAS